MPSKNNRKTLIIYGLLMGVLFLLLQAINYNTMIRDIKLEVYGALIALLFLGLGIWLGSMSFKKKKSGSSIKAQKKFNLSSRELDVLNLMSEGLTNKEIANRLYVSHNTIKSHTSNIYSKLDVERRTQAIQKAIEFELI
jgi:DNA-binding NarL/FixJ family response regulator